MGELCLHDVRTIQVLDPWITPSTGAVSYTHLTLPTKRIV